MEWTNLVFAGLLFMVMLSGMSIFFVDVQTNYPETANTQINGTMANLTESVTEFNTVISSSTVQASTYTSSDNPLTAALGYLFGSFTALGTLLQIPSIFLNFIAVINAFGAPFIPIFVVNSIIVAVNMVVLIGVLYYLLKVK